MRKTSVAVSLAATLGMVILARPAPAQASFSVSVRIGDFYEELSRYGEWVECRYGECWVPRGIRAGWQPYSNGEWVYTRYGWTWVSNDPWGGDPYHYGTWDFVDRYGWVWVPGTVWAPAWVTWSYSDRYVGWAPMPPTIRFGRSGYSGRAVVVNQTRYVFVPTNQFVGTHVASVRVEPGRNAEIFRQARPVTRFDVTGGVLRNAAVPFAAVQQATSARIETRDISSADTTPRDLSSGGVARTGQVAIVAPAREMKAARASRQMTAPQPQRPQQQARPQQQDARPEQQPRPQRQEARPRQQVRPQQQEARPQPQSKPQQQDARPQQQARPQLEARPQEAVRPQEPAARPQKQVKARQETRPAGEERGKGENKAKKDPPGRDGRPD